MPGDYTEAEVAAMNATELVNAQSLGWRKPKPIEHPYVLDESHNEVELKPSKNVWGARGPGGNSTEFTCPSGQICRLRVVQPEELLVAGILDKVTRLEGLADILVQKAEGQPPKVERLPTREELGDLLQTINAIIPLAVAEPKVYADGDPNAPEGCITTSMIDLEDRMAIMEKALGGLRLLDRFHRP